MAVELVDIRKVAVFSWGEDIKGANASLQVDDEEKRTVKNDHESNLFFPLDHSGYVTVTVKGSSSGEETGTLNIT